MNQLSEWINRTFKNLTNLFQWKEAAELTRTSLGSQAAQPAGQQDSSHNILDTTRPFAIIPLPSVSHPNSETGGIRYEIKYILVVRELGRELG